MPALPAGWETVGLGVVMRSMIELFGRMFCFWFIPAVFFQDSRASTGGEPATVR